MRGYFSFSRKKNEDIFQNRYFKSENEPLEFAKRKFNLYGDKKLNLF